jgi:hypothetical protein
MKKVFLFAIVILGFSAVSFGQALEAFTNVKTTATIITPISIAAGEDLMFGSIIADGNGGTVTVGTDGTPTYSGITTQSAIAGTIQAATFTVSGLIDATFAITLPDAFELVGPSGSDAMSVASFVTDPDETSTIVDGGTIIKVGATLTVNENQAPGDYANDTDLKITVAYN